MNLEDKQKFIDDVLGFWLDCPIAETAADFPSPGDFIQTSYLTALTFDTVRKEQDIPEEHYEALLDLIDGAESEYKAAWMLREPPDVDEPLDMGLEDDIPEGFAKAHQPAIWRAVIAIQDTDKRLEDSDMPRREL